MAGPGDGGAAGTGGRGRLRASHADREQAIEVLKVAFVQGRLDSDEFGLRVGRALASRTYADLAALTADLPPARLAAARPLEPSREPANKNNKKKAAAALSCATLAYPGLLAALSQVPDTPPFAVPVRVAMFAVFVLFGAVVAGWLLLLHAWLDERAGTQSGQGLPPGAGGAASRSLAPAGPAGPAGQPPPAGRGPRHAASAACPANIPIIVSAT